MFKSITSILIGSLVALSSMVAFADSPATWAQEAVSNAKDNGYFVKSTEGQYTRPIKREEFAELFVEGVFYDFNKRSEGTKSIDDRYGIRNAWKQETLDIDFFLHQVKSDFSFTDTNSKHVKIAYMMGVTNGTSASTFGPDELITREQVACFMANYLQNFVSVTGSPDNVSDIDTASSWARDAVEGVITNLLMNGKQITTKQVTNPYGYEYTEETIYFDTKGTLTVQEAYKLMDTLIRSNKLYYHRIALNKIVLVNMEMIQNGIEIDGYQVKLINGGYENKQFEKYYMENKATVKEYVQCYFGNNADQSVTGLDVTITFPHMSTTYFTSGKYLAIADTTNHTGYVKAQNLWFPWSDTYEYTVTNN